MGEKLFPLCFMSDNLIYILDKTRVMHKTFHMVSIFLAVLCFFISVSTLAGPFGFNTGRFTLFTEPSYVTTNKNYDDNGSLYVLNPPNQLTEIAIPVGSTYDFNSSAGAYAVLTFKQINSKGLNYNYSVTGISDLVLGTDFVLVEGNTFKIIPDFSVDIPLSGVPTSGAAFMNDGSFAVQGLLGLSSRVWNTNTYLYGGFLWRSQGLSSQIPIGLLAKINVSRKFFVNFKTFGEISLANDQYSNQASTRNLLIAASNGGSFLYDSVNPSYFAAKASLGWNVSSSVNLSLGVRQTFIGYKVADETRFFLNFTLNKTPGKHRTFVPEQRFQQETDDKFEVDTEGE